MICRGNCDERESGDIVNPEGLLEEPFPPDVNRPLMSVADQPEPDITSSGDRKLPLTSLCRYNCEETESVEVGGPDRLSSDQSQLPVADQPEPKTVPESGGENPTDTDAMTGAEEYPERTEFVVHVEQEPPPSPPAQSHHCLLYTSPSPRD